MRGYIYYYAHAFSYLLISAHTHAGCAPPPRTQPTQREPLHTSHSGTHAPRHTHHHHPREDRVKTVCRRNARTCAASERSNQPSKHFTMPTRAFGPGAARMYANRNHFKCECRCRSRVVVAGRYLQAQQQQQKQSCPCSRFRALGATYTEAAPLGRRWCNIYGEQQQQQSLPRAPTSATEPKPSIDDGGDGSSSIHQQRR